MEAAPEKKPLVCVTGGAGYLASWLVMKLLRLGYAVRATVRTDPKHREETSHLTSLPGADNLEIHDLDLYRPESFAPAVAGCVGVFHVAHPTDFSLPDPERTVIQAAVDGVVGLLKACVDSGTVRRFVYTSSASAVAFARTKERVVDESKWTDVEFCREQDVPISTYFVSKTMAERAVLEFGEENGGVEVVTVLPSSVVGPFLVPYFPPSFATSLALVRGDREHCKLLRQMQFVHIDDAASAHIFLFECLEARGRYICSAVDSTLHMLLDHFSAFFPEFHIPTHLLQEVEEEEEEEPLHLSSKKLLDLGFEYKYKLVDMFAGAIECCKQKGFL